MGRDGKWDCAAMRIDLGGDFFGAVSQCRREEEKIMKKIYRVFVGDNERLRFSADLTQAAAPICIIDEDGDEIQTQSRPPMRAIKKKGPLCCSEALSRQSSGG
jgi:hypothetical protein